MRHFCWQSSGSVDLDQSRSASRLALHVVKSTVNVTARPVAASGHCPAQTRASDRRGSAGAAIKLKK
jgi:hypothetical protein